MRWQHLFNAVFMLFIIRAGWQILADHPRLYLNSGSRPGTDWLRLRGPIPADRMDQRQADRVWTAKDDSVALPKHEHITQHYCIQGWSAIGKWGGGRMSDILEVVKPAPEARWVVFYSFAEGPEGPAEGRYYDCHRIEHMHNDTTLLAYEMNGDRLTETHRAPVRLRNEDELGFKQVKWIETIEFVESFSHIGWGQGGYNEDHELFGYRMPI